jgi:DNA-binding response OmpR family regulator
MQHSPVVAIIHEDEAVARLLAEEIEASGLRAVTAALGSLVGSPDEALALFARHDPRVVVFDVSPNDESVPLLAFLRSTKVGSRAEFVLTTTAEHESEPLLREAIDLRSCPHAVDTLVSAVTRAATARQAA